MSHRIVRRGATGDNGAPRLVGCIRRDAQGAGQARVQGTDDESFFAWQGIHRGDVNAARVGYHSALVSLPRCLALLVVSDELLPVQHAHGQLRAIFAHPRAFSCLLLELGPT